MDYPWYELLDNCSEITQGDIIKNCPVPRILSEIDDIQENQSIKTEISLIDGIVLTQACDIANNKVENVIMCAITTKDEYEAIQRKNGKSEKDIANGIKSIVSGHQYAYHIINNYNSEGFIQDYYIICFKDIYSIPLGLAKNLAKKNGKRLRLNPPYREHLSQAFARYFMRVGLPINIKI